MVYFSLLQFCSVCEASPNSYLILLYDYKQLTECISEVERVEAKVNIKKKDWLAMKKKGDEKQEEEEEEEEEMPTTMDAYFI
jgi:hypothetical protein